MTLTVPPRGRPRRRRRKPSSKRRAASSAAAGGGGWRCSRWSSWPRPWACCRSEAGGPTRSASKRTAPAPAPQVQRRVNGPSLGLATSYQLTGPIGVAVDRAGDIYFTDGNRVYEVVRATQQLEVVAGTGAPGFSGDGGPGPEATLSGPSGIAVAPNGDVYFEDGNRVRKVSAADGVISTVAGDGRAGSQRERRPGRQGLAELRRGRGHRRGSQRLPRRGSRRRPVHRRGRQQRGPEGVAGHRVITGAAGPGIHCGPLDGICQAATHPCAPVGVAVDGSSNVFLATGCGAIRERVAATGVTSTIFSTNQDRALAGKGGDHDPTGLAVGSDKTLFVTEAYGRRLFELDMASGRVVPVAGTGTETLAANPARPRVTGDRLPRHLRVGLGRRGRWAGERLCGRLLQRRHPAGRPADRCDLNGRRGRSRRPHSSRGTAAERRTGRTEPPELDRAGPRWAE